MPVSYLYVTPHYELRQDTMANVGCRLLVADGSVIPIIHHKIMRSYVAKPCRHPKTPKKWHIISVLCSGVFYHCCLRFLWIKYEKTLFLPSSLSFAHLFFVCVCARRLFIICTANRTCILFNIYLCRAYFIAKCHRRRIWMCLCTEKRKQKN